MNLNMSSKVNSPRLAEKKLREYEMFIFVAKICKVCMGLEQSKYDHFHFLVN